MSGKHRAPASEVNEEMIDRALVPTINALRAGLSPSTIATVLDVPFSLVMRIGWDAGLIPSDPR